MKAMNVVYIDTLSETLLSGFLIGACRHPAESLIFNLRNVLSSTKVRTPCRSLLGIKHQMTFDKAFTLLPNVSLGLTLELAVTHPGSGRSFM